MSEFKNIFVSNLTTKAQIYSTPLTKKTCIVSFFIANKTMANMVYVSVYIRQLGVDYTLINQLPLSSGSTLLPLEKNKLFLMPGDILSVESSEEVDIIISYIENI